MADDRQLLPEAVRPSEAEEVPEADGWEFHTTTFNLQWGHPEERANALGRDGWEPLRVMPYTAYEALLVFRRPWREKSE